MFSPFSPNGHARIGASAVPNSNFPSADASVFNAQASEQTPAIPVSVPDFPAAPLFPPFASQSIPSYNSPSPHDPSQFPLLGDPTLPPALNFGSRENSLEQRLQVNPNIAETVSPPQPPSMAESLSNASMNPFPRTSTSSLPPPKPSDGLLFLASSHEPDANNVQSTPTSPPSLSASSSLDSSTPCATLHKVCWYCALTSCAACYENSRRPTYQPQPCHSPEQGRFVCSSCSALHKTISIPMARVLTVPIALAGDFQLELQSLAISSSIAALSAPNSSPTSSSSSSLPLHNSCFGGSFYTHLLNRARRFEIFDAFDLSLWAEALPFTEIYVFETAESAAHTQAMLPKYLMSVAKLVANCDSHVILRLCSQCNAYQVQCPVQRAFADAASCPNNSAASGDLRRKMKMLPNFYSAGLCRKSNASHLKKQSNKSSGSSCAENDAEADSSNSNCKRKRKQAGTSTSAVSTPVTALQTTSSNVPSGEAVSKVHRIEASLSSVPNLSFQGMPINMSLSSSTFTASLFSSANSSNSAASSTASSFSSSFLKPSFNTIPTSSTLPQFPSSSSSSSTSSLPLARSSAPFHGFRARVAFRMLARHQFAMFESYLQNFPPDRIHRPFEAMCTELFQLCTDLLQFMDVVYFLNATAVVESAFKVHPEIVHTTSSRLKSTLAISDSSSCERVNASANAKSLIRLGGIFVRIYELHSSLGSLLSPLVLCNPAMVLQYHLARFSVDSFSTNASVMAGVALDHQSKRSPTRKSIATMIAMGAECLDNVAVIREFESMPSIFPASSSATPEVQRNICSAQPAPSPLFVFALHVEAVTRWLLGIAIIRAEHAQMWHHIKVRNGNTMLMLGDMSLESANTVAQLSKQTSRESSKSPSSTSNDHIGLDGVKILQQTLRFSEFHSNSGNCFDLRASPFGAANELNLPPHSMKAMSLNPLLSLLFSSIEHHVLAEKLRLIEPTSEFADTASSAGISIDELFSWSLLSSERVDSSPQMYPYVLVTVQLASQYSASKHNLFDKTASSGTSISSSSASSTAATAASTPNSVAYMQTMNQLLSKHRGESLRQLQRTCVCRNQVTSSENQPSTSSSSSSSTSSENADSSFLRRLSGDFAPELSLMFTAPLSSIEAATFQLSPGKNYRSFEPLRFALRALSLAHEIDDSVSIAYCASVLCSMLLYYLPRHDSFDRNSSISIESPMAESQSAQGDQMEQQERPHVILFQHHRHQCYTLALQFLQKLHQECSELLQHMDPHIESSSSSSSTSFERSRIIACQDFARFTLVQLEQHLCAGLQTPFFAGKLVKLPSEHGLVDAIVCPLGFSAPVLVLCEHPHHGEYHLPSPSELMWSVLSTESRLVSLSVQQTIMWQSLADGSYFDCPGSLLQNSFASMMLLHELQCGRYTFDRFKRDLIARAAIDVSSLFSSPPSSTLSSPSSPAAASSSSLS